METTHSSVDGGEPGDMVDNPAELLKVKLNAGGDSKRSVCNGNVPINGDINQGQNGNHDKHEAMEVDEIICDSNDGSSCSEKAEDSKDGMMEEPNENGSDHAKNMDSNGEKADKDCEAESIDGGCDNIDSNHDSASNYESSKDSTDAKPLLESKSQPKEIESENPEELAADQSEEGVVEPEKKQESDGDVEVGCAVNDDSKPQTPREGSVDDDSKPQTPRDGSVDDDSKPQSPRDGSVDDDSKPQSPRDGSVDDDSRSGMLLEESVNEDDSKPQTPQSLIAFGDESKPQTPHGESGEVSKADSAIASGTNTPSEAEQKDKTASSEPQEDLQRALDVARRDKKLTMIEEAAKNNEELRPVAKLLYGIGTDLARQQIYKDLYRVQSKKKSQNKLNSRELMQLDKLHTTYDELISKNDTYQLDLKGCEKCGFKTESKNVIEWHLEFAHGQDEGKYECSFCDFETRLPAPFFFHMEAEHNRKGRVFMKKAFFSCPQCPYENNSKSSVGKHRLKCDRQFNLKRNQEPLPTDCDIPLKKPKTLPPKRMPGKPSQPGVATPTNAGQRPVSNNALKSFLETRGKPQPQAIQPRLGSPAFATVGQGPGLGVRGTPGTVQSLLSAQRQQLMTQQVLIQQQQQHRPRILQQMPRAQVSPASMYTLVNTQGQLVLQPTYPGPSIQQPVQQVRPTTQPIQFLNTQQNIQQLAQQVVQQVTAAHAAAHKGKPEVPNKSPQTGRVKSSSSPAQSGQAGPGSSPQFEICEICGGFVKDRESLRIHFYWAHKVDIQKDVFSRLTPHLKCEVCPQSFWTYQGLVRHRQMSHAKAKERTYRCYLCGAKNIANIITHLNSAHNVSLNTMYKTGKCLVCGLGFAGEKGLKRHIHTAHLELLKAQPGSSPTKPGPFPPNQGPSPMNRSPPKSQMVGAKPVPTGLFENSAKKQKKFEPVCSICNIVFPNVDAFTLHCNRMHVFKCTRCSERWATQELLQKHWHDKHRTDTDACVLCHEQVLIGRPFVRHMKRSHLTECSVVLVRMKKSQVDFYMKRLEDLAAEIKKNAPKPDVIILDDEEAPATQQETKEGKSPSASQEKAAVAETDDTTPIEIPDEEPEASKPVTSDRESGVREEILEVDGEKIVVQEVTIDEEDEGEKVESTVEETMQQGEEKTAEEKHSEDEPMEVSVSKSEEELTEPKEAGGDPDKLAQLPSTAQETEIEDTKPEDDLPGSSES